MRSWYGRLRLMALGSVLVGLASIAQCADVANQKKILYLTAEGLEHQYFGPAYTAFKTELDKALPNATIVYAENLDLARFNEAEHKQSLTAWLRSKYAKIHFDAIVTAGTPALKFAVDTQLWPDVPTATEAGFPALTFEGLLGVFAPRDTPRERLDRISAEIGSIAAQPEIASRLAVAGQIVRAGTPAEFSAAIAAQRAKIMSIVRLIGRPNG